MSKSHDIFLLMLNLTQLSGTEQILSLFTGGIKDLWAGLDLTYDDRTYEAQSDVLSISTMRRRFGVFRIKDTLKKFPEEDQVLIRNAVQMLAVVLENAEQAALLEREKDRLDEQVKQRSSELVAKNEELEAINTELLAQIEKRELAEAERELFFSLSIDLLCIAGLDGYLKQVNPTWTQVLGWSEEELLSRVWIDFLHPDDVESSQNSRSVLIGGKELFQYENRYLCKGGGYRLISWNALPLTDRELVFAIGRDITEARLTEEELRQAEKMQAVGQLAGGVAHDFNNQLAGILGFAELLRFEVGDNSELMLYTENILRSVKRASDLTSQLLAYARKGKYLTVSVDIHEVIDEVISLLERAIDKNIDIKQILNSVSPLVTGDPSQLQNALLNLGLNARDAMPDGGDLTIATDTVYLDDGYCTASSFSLTPGSYLQLSVSDSGTGIEKEVQQRIFEPFFTTKPEGQGTGMGLSAVYGTVLSHNGAIEVTTDPGNGTSFTICLPHADLQEEGEFSLESDTVSGDEPISGIARILVVDDEPVVRKLATKMLNRLGYSVQSCSNGTDAVKVYQKDWRDFDCVIVDMIMPNLSGKETYLAMRRINPGLKAILLSGYSLDAMAQDVMASGMNAFIQKPFSLNVLSNVVAETLGTSKH